MAKKFLDELYEIKEDFFRKHLQEFTILAPFNYGGFLSTYKPVKTDVSCPFCEDGIIELTNKKKDICEVHVCHNGNSYQFRCSEKCNNVLFTYTNTWLYC